MLAIGAQITGYYLVLPPAHLPDLFLVANVAYCCTMYCFAAVYLLVQQILCERPITNKYHLH